MKVIRKRPGEPAELIEVEYTLEAMQEEIGGYIETVTLISDCTILCDEEGRIKGKPPNCNLLGVDFVGTILVVGVAGDELCDVPEGIWMLFETNEKAPAGQQPDASADETYQI